MNTRSQLTIAVLVIAAFAVLVAVKTLGGTAATPAVTSPSGSAIASSSVPPGAPSQSRADAVAAYEAATQAGKPIYVLFHSLTCDPCIEISAIADKVVPSYAGRVVFVNAITDDDSGRALAARFDFQYIPTSFFIDAHGAVVGSHTGVLSEADMRARLDGLAAK